MTTQTKAADPVLPALGPWLEEQLNGAQQRAVLAYGRACYERARADLIASMEAIAAVSPGGHVFAIDPDVTTAVELWQRGDRPFAIIPEK